MKVTVESKKGLKTNLKVFVDKKTIQKKLDEKLSELQGKVQLKGFRPGKVPPSVIKSQFGKAIYGEVIDGILKETSDKAIKENKLKIAGQPKIDLKTFGEGKDLDYTLEIETLPKINLKSIDSIKATDYEISVENKLIEKRINEISESQQNFSDKNEDEKAIKGDLVVFDYVAKVENKDFEGNKGKNTQLVLGKDLFIKGFDDQLIGAKKNKKILVTVTLPENYPKKELANKKAVFECQIINLKKQIKNKIDDEFAKKLGAKSLEDLKLLVKKQITSQYLNTLNTITKKNILKQIESSHSVDLPANLVEQEAKILNENLKKEDIEKYKEKNLKLAKSRIKVGLILNEIGEKNNLTIKEEEIKKEIQKQVQNMPGQEKFVMEYYQKTPAAVASLRGALYEEKIIDLIKTKIKLDKKNISLNEAEQIIKKFTNSNEEEVTHKAKKKVQKSKIKKKK